MDSKKWRALAKGDVLRAGDQVYTWTSPDCVTLGWVSAESGGYIGEVINDGFVPARRPAETPATEVQSEPLLAVRVNGKTVCHVTAYSCLGDAEARALEEPKLQRELAGREQLRVVFDPGRSINFVVCE